MPLALRECGEWCRHQQCHGDDLEALRYLVLRTYNAADQNASPTRKWIASLSLDRA